MPIPAEYQRATDKFYEYMTAARDEAGLGSTHQAFTMTEGVFRAFRRRLTLEDALAFANVLPVGLRALFVTDWKPTTKPHPFESRERMTREVQALRGGHNFAPDTAILDVARALRTVVDDDALDRVLERLPDGARKFWRVV
jgi:uncharacterized protein (DUF2267 family)